MGVGDTETIVTKPTRSVERVLGDGSIKIDGVRYPVFIPKPSSITLPSTPTIISVATTDGSWTEVATGLTGVILWQLTELNGNDIQYAFVVAPGDNFSMAFGGVTQETNLNALYVRRPTSSNITVKLERWAT